MPSDASPLALPPSELWMKGRASSVHVTLLAWRLYVEAPRFLPTEGS